ncbi:MAG: pantoate--beta-alanine ligase [Thermodesulfobacteriota bacterium]|nr:MAG: pantoate--beta-alanine ligase [Thermodesulfobacteriota bacterium]
MKRFSAGVRDSGVVVTVPTMGALHRGHVELLKIGRRSGDCLILTIFVNPAQFGPGEDFSAYPRGLEKDLKVAEEAGVDVVFNPTVEQMYGRDFKTYVEVEDLSKKLCGLSRTRHFRGVATVVLKLFNITMCHKAVFGMKDFQQLQVIKRMVRDLNLDVEIIGAETVRDNDGLAVSSRNAYLSVKERRAASAIPRALFEARKNVGAGMGESASIVEGIKKILATERLLNPEYVKVCDPETLEDLDSVDPEKGALIAVAVKAGRTRLIDNVLV